MVSIRTMIPADRGRVADLIYLSTNQWYQKHFSVTPFASAEDTAVFYDVYHALDPDCGVVAELDGRIVGSCFYHPRETHMSLGIMNAHPDVFGKGVASRILNHIVNEAERRQLPLRLVSSAMNLDSFSLYSRAGFVPRVVYNDLLFAVPEQGVRAAAHNAIRVRTATAGDARAMCDFESQCAGIRRTKDYAYFLENKSGFWHVSIAEQAGRTCGWLVSCCHPASRMLGPGCMADDNAALALITQELNLFRGKSVLALVPAAHNALVRQLYAVGGRNCEIHLAQCRGTWAAQSGISMPTFLPETA